MNGISTEHASPLSFAPQPLIPPAPLGSEWTEFWPLDSSYDFLNHGSFGSVPRPVREAHARYGDLVESRPIEVLGRRYRELLAPARERVSRFLRADSAGLGFVTNATEGVNAVLRSIELRPGDVLVTTDHVYRAIHQTMKYIARRAGAEVRVVPIPLPTSGPDEIVDRIERALDGRTRIVVVDHVTSPTALIFPVERIAAVCRARGIASLIDGAHAPGMLDLDIAAVGATYYAGNLHKWVCAPKGCAFVWADESVRQSVHPATVSHFLDEGFDAEFDWQGTRDIGAWLTAQDAIALFEPLTWRRLREHNRGLARWAHAHLCEALGAVPRSPASDDMLGAMAAVVLPEHLCRHWENAEALQADLYQRERIEVPIVDWGGRWHVRVSCQAYNRPEQVERLSEALLSRAHR
ncbi:MAG: aminotransferase class V-fold PLP-dependent enzyme [Phycisphaerae bacterium]|nr:aminotransferase class V-fold PLP-dependent enzyme [Phycisphaerae bacterium]